jgi:hypothetical protein
MRTKLRAFTLLLLLAVLIAPATTYAESAHEQAGCTWDALRQDDMAGVYESAFMRLEVYPCGGVYLRWINAYGDHSAAYGSIDRLSQGGVVAVGISPDPSTRLYLDGRAMLLIKPAEPGFVQVASMDSTTDLGGVYRLAKTGTYPRF